MPRGSALARRYGPGALARGYTAVPNLLLARYRALGLGDGELVFVIELLSYWPGEGLPCPALATIAARMGKSVRQLQTYVERLRGRGLLGVIARRDGTGRQVANAYDLSPLLGALGERAEGEAESRPALQPASAAGVRPASPIEDHDQKASDLDPMAPYPRHGLVEAPDTPRGVPDAVEAAVLSLGRELGDDAPASSVTRVAGLAARAGLASGEILRLLAEARARTLERRGTGVRRAMAYCLTIFESLLRPRPPRRARCPDQSDNATEDRPVAANAGSASGDGQCQAVWSLVREELRQTLPPAIFAARVSSLRVRGEEAGALVIEAASDFEREWLARALSRRIGEALRVLGRPHMPVRIDMRAA